MIAVQDNLEGEEDNEPGGSWKPEREKEKHDLDEDWSVSRLITTTDSH